MQLNVVFHRKEPAFDAQASVVEKVIELNANEYAYFRRSMLRDHAFIAANSEAMWVDKSGAAHCLLVMGEGHDDGVLVRSEGASYARYAAFIPGARQLLMAEEMKVESAFKERLGRIHGVNVNNADMWVQQARALAEADTSGNGLSAHAEYCRHLRNFGEALNNVDQMYTEVSAEIINYRACFRPEEILPVAHQLFCGNSIEEVCAEAQEGDFQPLNYAADMIAGDWFQLREDSLVSYNFADMAREFGLQASQMPLLAEKLRSRAQLECVELSEDNSELKVYFRPFNPGMLSSVNTSEPGAAAADRTMNETKRPITQAELDEILADLPADFSGRLLVGVKLSGNRGLESSDFRGAILRGCTISHCKFDNSDFSGADFSDSTFVRCKMEYCTFDGAKMGPGTFDRCALFGSTGADSLFEKEQGDAFADEPEEGLGGMGMTM